MRRRMIKHLEPQLAVLRDVDERMATLSRSMDQQREKRDALIQKIEERKKKVAELSEAGADVREIMAVQDHIADESRMLEIMKDSLALQNGGKFQELRTAQVQAQDALEGPFLTFMRDERERLELIIMEHLELVYRLAKEFDGQITEAQGELQIGLKRGPRERLVSFPSCYGSLKKLEDFIHAGPSFPELMAAKASNHGRL